MYLTNEQKKFLVPQKPPSYCPEGRNMIFCGVAKTDWTWVGLDPTCGGAQTYSFSGDRFSKINPKCHISFMYYS